MKITEQSGFLSKHKEAVASAFLCLAAVAAALILHPAYETNDDTLMESLLFGYQGQRTSFLIFINRVLCYILYFLVSVCPKVNWYFIMHWSTCILSLYVLARVFIRKFKSAGFFVSLLMVAAGMETLFMPQFTKTAALAVISGTIGVLDSLREKRSPGFRIVCIWLIVTGSMIRFESLIMVSPFLLCVTLYETVLMYKERKEQLKRYVAVLGITLVLVALFYLAGTFLNKRTPGSDEFYRINYYRSMLTDHEIDYAAIKDRRVLTEIALVTKWLNNDPEVFTPERYEQLYRDYHVEHGLFSSVSVKALFGHYLPNAIQNEPLLLVCAVVAVAFVLLSKRRYLLIPLAGFYLLLELYLCSTGRSNVHRVDFGILLSFLASVLYVSGFSFPGISDDMKKLVQKYVVPLLLLMGVVAVCSFPVQMHLTNSRYNNEVNAALEDITSNKDYKYMVYTLALRVDSKRNIFDPPTAYNDGFFYMGGWQEGIAIPGISFSNHSGIEGNPWVTCIDSSEVRLVLPKSEGENPWMKEIAGYVKEHYGRSVKGIPEYGNDSLQLFRVVSTD